MDNDLWMKNYVRLTNFLRDNGRYPNINAKDESEKALAMFVKVQRLEYENKTIDKYREKLLNHIQFYWGYDKVKNDDSLDNWQGYEQTYVQKMIDANGARFKKDGTYKTNKVKEWELNQRKLEKSGALDEDREYELNKVGFYFDDSSSPRPDRRSEWFKNYNILLNMLKMVYGNYQLLKTLPEFKKIEKWYNKQLAEEKNGAMEDYRKILLDNLAFPFDGGYRQD